MRESKLRISLYNVREPISQVATLLGRAELQLKQLIQEDSGCSVRWFLLISLASKTHPFNFFRLPLKSITPDIEAYTTGFVTASSWTLKVENSHASTESTPCKSPLKQDAVVNKYILNSSFFSNLYILDLFTSEIVFVAVEAGHKTESSAARRVEQNFHFTIHTHI